MIRNFDDTLDMDYNRVKIPTFKFFTPPYLAAANWRKIQNWYFVGKVRKWKKLK